jgi:hypothetical protein
VQPVSRAVKGGEKTFAVDTPRIWGTGWRLGVILRKAREEAKQPEQKEVLEGNEGRRGPAPHIYLSLASDARELTGLPVDSPFASETVRRFIVTAQIKVFSRTNALGLSQEASSPS